MPAQEKYFRDYARGASDDMLRSTKTKLEQYPSPSPEATFLSYIMSEMIRRQLLDSDEIELWRHQKQQEREKWQAELREWESHGGWDKFTQLLKLNGKE